MSGGVVGGGVTGGGVVGGGVAGGGVPPCEGAEITSDVATDVDDAALPTPFVSVTMTVIESPTTALVMT